MDKKQTLLIVLAVVFVITLVYRIMNPYRQETVSSLTYTAGHRQAAVKKGGLVSAGSPDLNADIMVERSMRPESQQVMVFRNIFEKKAPARDVNPAGPSDTGPSRETQGGITDTVPQDSEQYRMNQDLAQFTAFGSYESSGERYIFLERSKDILIVRKGDIIDGRYRVEHISDRSMTFRSEIQGQSVTIDISDLFTIGL